MARRSDPIHIKASRKGKLRGRTHTAAGKEIPIGTLEHDAHSKSPKLREEAQFALNARHFNHGGSR